MPRRCRALRHTLETTLRLLTSRRRRSRHGLFERRAPVLPGLKRLCATPYRLQRPPGLDSSSPPRLLNLDRSTTARGVGRENGGFGPGCALGSASQRCGELKSRRTLRCGAVVAILKSTAATKFANAAAARGHGKRDALRDLEGLCTPYRERKTISAPSRWARHTANVTLYPVSLVVRPARSPLA